MQNNFINISEWGDAHVFFDEFLSKSSYQNRSWLQDRELFWRSKISESPNGHLFTDNSFFKSLRKGGIFSMMHVTTKLDEIEKNGALYSSAGCLVGSIYATPLYSDSNRYYCHNLGSYILNKEAPRSRDSAPDSVKRVDPLIIELKVSDSTSPVGVDYLKLGSIHFDIYTQLKYLLSMKERADLEGSVLKKIRQSSSFLSLCHNLARQEVTILAEDFLNILNRTIPYAPILGYIYFEVVAEYMALFGQDPMSMESIMRGELPNWGYKEMTFQLYPSIAKEFSLTQFNPTQSDLSVGLKKVCDLGYCSVSISDLMKYISYRMPHLVATRLLSPHFEVSDYVQNNISEESAHRNYKPYFGHLIHRELRSFHRYNDFYFYFDQFKALQIWNYWNQMDIALPFNGVMPKGEVGINPAYPDLEYKVYLAKKEESGSLIIDRELAVKILPRLVDLRYTFMRSKGV